MNIYTKTGDKGTTSLVYGERVSKQDSRVEAYGTLDEANSFIGLALSELHEVRHHEGIKDIIEPLQTIQTTLFHAGAELSTPADKQVKWPLTTDDVNTLEHHIDTLDATLPKLTQFVLPGGHVAAAHLHVARTIIRRAERLCVGITNVSPVVLAYLNRLSDLLFVLARSTNHFLGMEESILQPKK